MLGQKLSEQLPQRKRRGCACCGGDHDEHEHAHEHGGHDHAHAAAGADHGHSHEETIRLGVAITGGLLVLNSYLAEFLLPRALDPVAIELSALLGALILAVPILWTSAKDIIRGKIYMNELVALALLAAFAIRDYRTAGAVAFLMLLSITLEQRTAIGAEASIEGLIRLTPRQARRLRADDGAEEAVDVLDLKVGDVCRIRPGENFPADGTVISGTSTVNQASITGESLPADKAPGNDVFAGTQNLTGLVDVRVVRVGRDTTLGKVRDLIVAAESSRLPIMRMIDQYVAYYTPAILTLAALVWFFTRDLHRVIAVLIVACPCALVVATPSAVIAAIAAAARLGILIKDVSHIELAARIKAVVFDKTGTLTEGVLEVAKLHPAPGVELAELMLTATSTEANSNHPAAQAMRRLAQEAGITWEAPSDFREVAGKGVSATFGSDVCRVGRAAWLREEGLAVDGVPAPGADTQGMSIVYVARGVRVLGWIGMRDAVRPVAKAAIDQLRAHGMRDICMVTGDNESVAKVVGEKLGVTSIKAGCLPQEKVAFVEELRRRGDLVAVVGDGVNDAPALAAGDIGIAMGAIGSDVAVQSASIALMNNDLRRIPFLILLSRMTRSMMNQNLVIGLLVILGGLYLSTIGWLNPVAAAVIHIVGTLAVIFNSARLVRAGEDLDTAK